MSIKRRLNRIERKFNTANIGQRVNDLVLDLYLPPVEKDSDYMTREWVIEWLTKRAEIARLENHLSTHLFDDTVLSFNEWSNGGFLENVAPDYPQCPLHLKRYREKTSCIISAHLMDEFNIEPKEIEL